MNKAIVTYAVGAHEELLDVAMPTYKDFAHRHGYDIIYPKPITDDKYPPAWRKIDLLLNALSMYSEVVWLDCDVVIVNPTEDFPSLDFRANPSPTKVHSMVRHFEDYSEVPNTGVWRLTNATQCTELLQMASKLEVFTNHGWWEQAAVMTLMGYTVPPQDSHFPDTRCKNVVKTKWYNACQFMRLAWNSHPNYRADKPRIVHCSYPSMPQRLEVMRALVKDPHYDYPKYSKVEEEDDTDN